MIETYMIPMIAFWLFWDDEQFFAPNKISIKEKNIPIQTKSFEVNDNDYYQTILTAASLFP